MYGSQSPARCTVLRRSGKARLGDGMFGGCRGEERAVAGRVSAPLVALRVHVCTARSRLSSKFRRVQSYRAPLRRAEEARLFPAASPEAKGLPGFAKIHQLCACPHSPARRTHLSPCSCDVDPVPEQRS